MPRLPCVRRRLRRSATVRRSGLTASSASEFPYGGCVEREGQRRWSSERRADNMTDYLSRVSPVYVNSLPVPGQPTECLQASNDFMVLVNDVLN